MFLFYGLGALLILAPLFRAGNRPLPLLTMELIALALLALWFWRPTTGGVPLPRTMKWFLAILFLLPLMQLLPMPMFFWDSLPGRSFYANALQQANVLSVGIRWRTISLIPAETETAWLALLPPLAVFLVAFHMKREQLIKLTLVFLGIAVSEALLGLIQYGDGPNGVFRLGNTWADAGASGTYMNRNHLAGLLEMALPVSIALLVATIGHGTHSHHHYHNRRQRTLRQWVAHFSIVQLNQTLLFGVTFIAILTGLIFTRSRAGIGLAMIGLLLSTLLFSARLGGRNAYGLMGTLMALSVGFASLVGLVPVLTQFTEQDPLNDGRWIVFEATVHAIGVFFPLGSGAGTTAEVLHRFHPANFPSATINHVHNDYLEWILEFGLVAILMIATWVVF